MKKKNENYTYYTSKSITRHIFENCYSLSVHSPHQIIKNNPKVVGSIPTLVRVFLCPCVDPIPLVGPTLAWFTWVENNTSHYPPIVDSTQILTSIFETKKVDQIP